MAKSRFQNQLEAKIRELVEDRKEGLVGAFHTERTYQFECGYVSGLRDALKLCDEINKETE